MLIIRNPRDAQERNASKKGRLTVPNFKIIKKWQECVEREELFLLAVMNLTREEEKSLQGEFCEEFTMVVVTTVCIYYQSINELMEHKTAYF